MGGLHWPGPVGGVVDRLSQLLLQDITYTPLNDVEYHSTFRLALPNLFAGSLKSIPLSSSTIEGTPPEQAPNDSNQAQIKVVNPLLKFNLKEGTLTGKTVLSIDSAYPKHLKGPTELDVNLTSTKIDFSRTPGDSKYTLPFAQLRGDASWGPIRADFKLRLHLDTEHLARAVADQESLSGALNEGKKELTHPGFDFSAVIHAAIPLIGKVPLTKIAASAISTVPVSRPLTGAPTSFAMDYRMYGVIPTPPGSLFDVPAVGLGLTQGSFGESRGYSLTAAFLPTFSPTAMSAAGTSMLEKFPAYGYLELYGVTRVSDRLEVGARLTVAPSSLDVANLLNLRKAELDPTSDMKGMVMFRLEGRFAGF